MSRSYLLVAAVLLAVAGSVAGQTYSSSGDFSNAINPNGVWTYGSTVANSSGGYVPGGGGSLTLLDTNSEVQPGLRAWTTSGGVGVPSAAYNTSNADIARADSVFHPGHMILHAGPGLAGVVRFTAPAAGIYSLAVHFENRTTNRGWPVYVFEGGTLLDSATFANFAQGGGHDYSNPALLLAAGGTVDFMAGPRLDGDFNSTVTQVDAVLAFSPVPEPSAVLAVSSLAASCCWAGRTRRTR